MRPLSTLTFFSMAFSPRVSTVLSIAVTTSRISLRKSATFCDERSAEVAWLGIQFESLSTKF